MGQFSTGGAAGLLFPLRRRQVRPTVWGGNDPHVGLYVLLHKKQVQTSRFPTDQVVTCSHITIISRGADELLWTIQGIFIIGVLVGATNSWSRVDLWGEVLVTVVLGFFELNVGVIAEVDLVYRTTRSDE